MAILAVIVVVAVAAMALTMKPGSDDTGNSGDAGDVDDGDAGDVHAIKFLIKDEIGVYFWIEGSGVTVLDAFKDAAKEYDIPVTYSATAGADDGIQEMFGLEMDQHEGIWYYWSQYFWDGEEWSPSLSYMSNVESKDMNGYFAIVYGDGNNVPTTKPIDCVVWDKSTSGTVFTIESSTGLWFKINGTGDKMIDAFTQAVTKYKIPFVASQWSGSPDGIESIFNLGTVQEDSGAWTYWSQMVWDGIEWVSTDTMMNEIDVSDTPVMKVIYSTH